MKLRVVRENKSWLVIDKPAGFHTHPPENKELRILPRWNALGILERQFGEKLYPMHRLDRAASGLLVYSREREQNGAFQRQISSGGLRKRYFVLARGKITTPLLFDSSLKSDTGTELPSITRAIPCFHFELPIPHPRGGNRFFTVLSVEIETGRFHQIRRHFASHGIPLIGDTRHGDRKLNRQFAELTGCKTLFLRCMSLSFECPVTGERMESKTKWSRDWHRLFDISGACALATTSPSPAQPLLS